MAIRKEEDIDAMKMLKVKYEHAEELECLYRMNESYTHKYNDLKEVFNANLENEIDTMQNLKKHIREKLNKIDFNKIFIPLNLGMHIDHILTRRCIELIYKDKDIFYYEDTPYVCHINDMVEINKLTTGLISSIIEISNDEWLNKLKAVNCYKSYSAILWSSETEKINQLEYISNKYNKKSRSIRVLGIQRW